MAKKERPVFRPNGFLYAGLYTVGWFMIPVTIYSSDTLFTKFCSFHKRVLHLQNKSQKSILGLAFLASIFYSSISFNLYYAGLLKIIGIKSIQDFEGILSDQFLEED